MASLPGHVGAPLPCSLVKLVDIPEMSYYAKDGKGEVGRPSSAVLGAGQLTLCLLRSVC